MITVHEAREHVASTHQSETTDRLLEELADKLVRRGRGKITGEVLAHVVWGKRANFKDVNGHKCLERLHDNPSMVELRIITKTRDSTS